MTSIGIIGLGNMATAIVKGIKKANMNVTIKAYDKSENLAIKCAELAIKKCDTIIEAVDADYLLLAVKPQNITEVLSDIKPAFSDRTVILSILAGVKPSKIKGGLGGIAKIIQIMPNTPMLLGEGACALCRTENVSDTEFDFAQSLLNCSGMSMVVPADKMNEIIAINGSTPAYIYEFARCFMEYGTSVDLDADTCLQLFAQTLIGSGKMILESGYTIDELISAVCSKGGTTIQGIDSLREDSLGKVVDKACRKTVARAYELSEA